MQVSILMVRALAGALARAGKSRARFLELVGVDERTLAEGEARLSLEHYLRAIDAALTVSEDPAFGLHLGERASSVMFDVIGYLAESSTTLRQSVEAMERYSRIFAQGYDPQLVEAGDAAFIRFAPLRGDFAAVRLTAEFALAALLAHLRMFVGPGAQPTRVCFAYPPPPYAAEYERVFGAALRFDADLTELEFPRAWLEAAHAFPSPDTRALLEDRAERMLDRLERSASLTARVKALLERGDPRDMPVMDEVARTFQMSDRTLRRRLAAEGTTYGELVEQALMNEAKRLLRDPRMSIQEAAYAMGFAAPAAFHRAFKRWTGQTPKQFQASAR